MRRLKFFLLLAVLAGALGWGFYTYPVPLQSSFEAVRTLLLLGVFSGVTLGLGRAMLKRFGVLTTSVLQEFSFSFGLGCAGMSLIAQVLGLLGLLRVEAVFLTMVALVFVSLEHLEHFWSLSRRRLRIRGGVEEGFTAADTLALGACLLALVPVLALSLAPVTFYDSLVYHLALPQEWIKSGSWKPPDHVFFAWLPGAGESLWTICLIMDFSSTRLATLFNFICGLALAGALWDAAGQIFESFREDRGSDRSSWAPAILLAQPVAALAFGALIPDGLMTLHAFLAFYAFMLSLTERNHSQQSAWLILGSLLSGAAMADKPVALVPGLVLTALTLWRLGWEKELRRPLLLLAPLLILLPLLPWIGRNLAFKGNPFYPFGLSFMGWQIFSPASKTYLEHMAGFGLKALPWFKQWYLPLALVYDAGRFGSGGMISPLLLGLVPAVLIIPFNRTVRFLLAYLAGCFFLWALTGQILRFTLYALPAACLLAVVVLDALKNLARSRTWAVALEILVALSFLVGAGQTFLIVVKDFDPFPAALGLEAPGDYLQRRCRYYDAAQWADANLSPDTGILILNDQRAAYWPGKIQVASLYEDGPFVHWLAKSASSEELNRKVLKSGASYVFINWEESRRLAAGPEPHFNDTARAAKEAGCAPLEKAGIFIQWVQDYLRPVNKSGGGVLYQVMRKAPPQVPSFQDPGQGQD